MNRIVAEIGATLRREVVDILGRPYKWSEIDTQCVAVDPVLTALGWDVLDPRCVRRANRSGYGALQAFDLELFDAAGPRAVFEVKSAHSGEFNLAFEGKGFRVVRGDGSLREMDGRYVPNRRVGDGVAQLRLYCLKLERALGELGSPVDLTRVYPVLTNGRHWVVFDPHVFFDASAAEKPVDLGMVATVDDELVCGPLSVELLRNMARLIGCNPGDRPATETGGLGPL